MPLNAVTIGSKTHLKTRYLYRHKDWFVYIGKDFAQNAYQMKDWVEANMLKVLKSRAGFDQKLEKTEPA